MDKISGEDRIVNLW